jgi:hypothetical protein
MTAAGSDVVTSPFDDSSIYTTSRTDNQAHSVLALTELVNLDYEETGWSYLNHSR